MRGGGCKQMPWHGENGVPEGMPECLPFLFLWVFVNPISLFNRMFR